jgi:hypothetical protein
MKKFGIAAAVIVLTSFGAEAAPLSGEQIRKTVAGKTLVISARGHTVPVRFSSNGAMSASLSGMAATLSGGNRSDRGKWWISGDQLCQRWSKWLDAKTYCFRVSGGGSSLSWTSSDGTSGTARVAG